PFRKFRGAFAHSWRKCRDPIWGTGNRFIVHIAEYELSKMNRETLPGNETAVGADLSCAPPIYRPTRTLLCILAILLIVIIGSGSHPRTSRIHRLGSIMLISKEKGNLVQKHNAALLAACAAVFLTAL